MDDNQRQEGSAEPQAFLGDYFGDYAPTDFEDYDAYDADADMDEVEGDELEATGEMDSDDDEGEGGGDEDPEEGAEEEDALNYQEEGSWEPPVRGSDTLDIDDDASKSTDETNAISNLRATQHRTQEQLRAKTFVVRFPNPHAGSPSSQKGSSAYVDYQADGDPEGENPYHPFMARLDWEIARWAKMRGPGSTAVTELLAIKGVSFPGLVYAGFRLKPIHPRSSRCSGYHSRIPESLTSSSMAASRPVVLSLSVERSRLLGRSSRYFTAM